MTWNEKMSVGVHALDEDHKKLVAMINELFDGINAGKGKDVVGSILDRLIRYTVEHFRREEEFFASTAYPDTAAHKKEHEKLTAEVVKVQTAFKAGATATVSLEVMNFLKNWLLNHIQVSDNRYGPHLNGKGIR